MKVKVRLDDILLGNKKDMRTCAIARAVKRAFPDKTVEVTSTRITISNGETKQYRMPYEAERFVRRFDKSRFSVLPFTFEATQV